MDTDRKNFTTFQFNSGLAFHILVRGKLPLLFQETFRWGPLWIDINVTRVGDSHRPVIYMIKITNGIVYNKLKY